MKKMTESREERKANLRDWMTATSPLMKVGAPDKIDADDITFWWKATFGMRMKSKWVEKALYGKRKAVRGDKAP